VAHIAALVASVKNMFPRVPGVSNVPGKARFGRADRVDERRRSLLRGLLWAHIRSVPARFSSREMHSISREKPEAPSGGGPIVRRIDPGR